MGFFDKIKQSLTRTKEQFVERFDEIVAPRRRAGAAQPRRSTSRRVEALEEALISADVGVAATDQIVTRGPRAPAARARRVACARW